MENHPINNNGSTSSPWHSPAGVKMDRRRLRTPPLKSRPQRHPHNYNVNNNHYDHLHSPPPLAHRSGTRPTAALAAAAPSTATEQPFVIWRTRSLDDHGGHPSRGSPRGHIHEDHQEGGTPPSDNNTESSRHRPDQPLHSSFDASLLDNDNNNSNHDFPSIFRHNDNKKYNKSKSKLRAVGSAQQQQPQHDPSSWQPRHSISSNSSHYSDTAVSTPHSSGRKHLRQPKHEMDDGYGYHHETGVHHRFHEHASCTHPNSGDNEDDEDDFVCPGTVRKLARRNSGESATPVRSRGCHHCSSHRHAPPPHNNNNNNNHKHHNIPGGSVRKPPKLRFPLTPTAPNSTATTQPPTTQPTLSLEAPDFGKNRAVNYPFPPPPDSPSTTPFRFTSFPASLPRVHPPLSLSRGWCGGGGGAVKGDDQDPHNTSNDNIAADATIPDSVRKRMFGVPPSQANLHDNNHNNTNSSTPFATGTTHSTTTVRGSSTHPPHHPYHHSSHSNHGNASLNNQSREEDGTQNTSISSLSTQGEEDPRMPPVHTRLFMEEAEYAYSDDDDDDNVDNVEVDNAEGNDSVGAGAGKRTQEVGRTRLDFNNLTSPKKSAAKKGVGPSSPSSPPNEDSPFKDLGEAAEKDILRMTSVDGTDLSRPYEHRQVHSFPSTMSSHSPLRNLSGCDDMATASTAGMTGAGGTFEERTAQHPPHYNHPHHHLPATPEEVQLHFQFDEAQCSPIPGIPEEEDLRTRPPLFLRSGKPGTSRLPPKPYPHNATSESSIFKSNSPGNRGTKATAKTQDDARNSFSNDSVSSSASAKLRRRPMPDMSAFGADAGSTKTSYDRSSEEKGGNVRTPEPKLHCPPTPCRTPVWAHANDNSTNGAGAGGGPMVFHRSNSLSVTRVLATCTDSAFPSIEAAPTSGSNKADSSMDQEMDMGSATAASNNDSSTETDHPEAPPRIRRAVGEMGTISSFAADFETLGVLGTGAFADVYKVRSKLDNNLYAVKRNRRHFRGKRDRDLALAEVRSMQCLQKQGAPNQPDQHSTKHFLRYLLFFYRAWQEDGHFFCQTELCCRDTCREMMDCLSTEWNLACSRYPSLQRNLPAPDGVISGSPFDVGGRLVPNKTVWKICHDVCAGLSHIHARGLVHNDIKPSNIFFVAHEQLGGLCKIGDFGMAGVIGASDDGQEGDQMFMAPELLDNGVRHASADIFSFGLTLYELAAGFGFDLPKQGPRWHELRSGHHIPDLPSIRDTATRQLIQQMISPLPDKRPRAETILKQETVNLAGNACDEFLRDYIHDIDEYDRQQEELRATTDPVSDKYTPRNAPGASCRARVCSPTLGPFTSTSHNLFTPEAQSTS